MTEEFTLRAGELEVALPRNSDAGLYFIGRIHTPWKDRKDCPRQGRPDGPLCRIEVFEPWVPGLAGIAEFKRLEVLYWLHLSRRDVLLQDPRRSGFPKGVFALRSPLRPNPIGLQGVLFERVEGASLFVRGLDCLDGTPLIDIKPDRCDHSPNEGDAS